MRILVDNYVTHQSTEPVYLDRCFKIAGATSALWDRNRSSLYDTFDQFAPDVFVTDYKRIDPTLAKYLASAKKKIDVVFNVTNAAERQLSAIETFLQNTSVSAPFVFTNTPETLLVPQTTRLKIESILNGADIWLPSADPNFSINTAILAVGGVDPNIYPMQGSTHIINAGAEESYDFDATVPIHQGPSIYRNYERLVLIGKLEKVFTQRFFDAALHGKNFSIYCANKNDAEKCSQIMDSMKMNNIDSRVPILRSHTCLHRAKRFLQKLKCKEFTANLDKAIGELK